MRVNVAIIDSGLVPGPGVMARDFSDADTKALPHGQMIADLVRDGSRNVLFLDGRVFGASLVTSTAKVAAAVRWAVSEKAMIINLSLGLREDRPDLAAAVAEAIAAGCLVVAPSPARGGPVYPAAYPGVVSVTGDARCDLYEFSLLNDPSVTFGASPRPLGASKSDNIGGASFAAARVTGALAKFWGQGSPVDQLSACCRFMGRERR